MQIKSHTIDLKNTHPFKIAHGTRTHTETYIIEIEKDGIIGLGEATPVPYYGITPAILDELLNQNIKVISEIKWEHPAELHAQLMPLIGHNTFLLCAIDIAAYDYWAKKQNLPLYKALGLDITKIPQSNYTIGIDDIDVMLMKMKEVDFPIYKIKLGTDNDIEIVKALRYASDAVFRIDANCAWDVEKATENINALKLLGVEFIEQPLKADDIVGMKRLKAESSLPLIADESCIIEADVDKCFGAFDGVNIKLAKCGGITPALRMIANARSKHMLVMMGCMTESSVGISAIAHLLPLLDYVDMDGALLISNDPANGVKVINGNVIFTERNGTGAVLG